MLVTVDIEQFKDILSVMEPSSYRIFAGKLRALLYPSVTSRNKIKALVELRTDAMRDEVINAAEQADFNVIQVKKVYPRERLPSGEE